MISRGCCIWQGGEDLIEPAHPDDALQSADRTQASVPIRHRSDNTSGYSVLTFFECSMQLKEPREPVPSRSHRSSLQRNRIPQKPTPVATVLMWMRPLHRISYPASQLSSCCQDCMMWAGDGECERNPAPPSSSAPLGGATLTTSPHLSGASYRYSC